MPILIQKMIKEGNEDNKPVVLPALAASYPCSFQGILGYPAEDSCSATSQSFGGDPGGPFDLLRAAGAVAFIRLDNS